MGALAQERQREFKTFKHLQWTLKAGKKAYKGGAACLELSSSKVVPAVSGVGLVFIGIFDETVDATSEAKLVNVDHLREIIVEWLENDTTSPVSNLLTPGYWLDDHTVTADPSAASIAGLVWLVDARKGVAVERLNSLADNVYQVGGTLSYTSNDAAPAAIKTGGMYDVPTTAAASTITLPAAAKNGTWAIFTADGTKNGHTVQYRDATGPTNLTTALTASKRHMVYVVKNGGNWFANAYVSP